VAPALSVSMIAVTHIAFMLIGTVLVWNAGLSAWDYVWSPADPTEIWLLLALGYIAQAFWMLPVWGWLLLASAFAKSKPFLWATVPWVLLIIFQSWLNATRYFRFDNQIAAVIGDRLLGGVIPISMEFDGDNVSIGTVRLDEGGVQEVPLTVSSVLDRFAEPDMWYGIAVGIAFIAAAIYIRRYRDEG
jgi:ABC-2 type transport system permease protein